MRGCGGSRDPRSVSFRKCLTQSSAELDLMSLDTFFLLKLCVYSLKFPPLFHSHDVLALWVGEGRISSVWS